MRVLILSDYGVEHGGAEISTLVLREGLRSRGHDARILSSSARPSDLPILADIVTRGTLSPLQPWLQLANPFALRTLRRTIDEFRPDVVHVGIFLLQLSPLILPALQAYPVVHRAHWVRMVCPTGAKLLPDRSLCQKNQGYACHESGCLSFANWVPAMLQTHLVSRWRDAIDVIAAGSKATRNALVASGFRNVEVVYGGTKTVPLRPPLNDPPMALFAGRLVKEKGVDVLLRAWKQVERRLPGAKLRIAGDGPDRQILEAMGSPHVEFLGHLPHAKLEVAAAPCWVQVVPSVCFETFGRVALEAMMRGTAVIATRIGGIPEAVSDGVTGLLVAPNSENELAEALIRLLSDRAACESMGQAGRAVAERDFTEDRFVSSHLSLYERVIRNRSAAGGLSQRT